MISINVYDKGLRRTAKIRRLSSYILPETDIISNICRMHKKKLKVLYKKRNYVIIIFDVIIFTYYRKLYADGKINISEPYIDYQTDSVKISMSKLSVDEMDIDATDETMDLIKKI